MSMIYVNCWQVDFSFEHDVISNQFATELHVYSTMEDNDDVTQTLLASIVATITCRCELNDVAMRM